MSKYLFCFTYIIKNVDKDVQEESFCEEINEYLSSHLECDVANLDARIQSASDEELSEVADWASYSCSYMHNVLSERDLQLQSDIAQTEAEKLSEDNPDSYEDIYEDVCDDLSHEVTSTELIINGKVYRGI